MRLRSRWWLALTLCGGAAGAQVDTSAWPVVRMEMLAMDKAGAAAALRPDELTLTEDGRPAKVQTLTPATDAQSVCLVLDNSGSMYERMVSLKMAATRLIDELPAGDDVCLVDFTTIAYVDSELSRDRNRAKKGLTYVQAQGASSLFDTVKSTAEYLRRHAKNKSRAIVLMTDGDDNYSKIDLAGAVAALRTDGSPTVHVFRLAGPKESHADAVKGERVATTLARATGGIVYFPKRNGELEASVDELCRAMGNRVILTYTTETPARDGRERRVNLELDKTRLKQKSVLYAAEGYYAPLQ